jgi:EAL domain-containing protein (putative c-di-GMP-specific phosphodiesterase class I)
LSRSSRQRGSQWAGEARTVDDAGAGYVSLRHIIELRPRHVKLDRGLITGIRADPIRRAPVAGMLHFAGAIRVEIIAEGSKPRPSD